MGNKFLQLILISLDSAYWELHQYFHRICGQMNSSKVDIRSRESNSGPYDCEPDTLPHDHGHLKGSWLWRILLTGVVYRFSQL